MKTWTYKYKKGEVYGVDTLNDLPLECNDFFANDDEFAKNYAEHEYGSQRCIKSFSITYTIKNL